MTSPSHAAAERSFGSLSDFYRGSAYARFPQEHRFQGSLGVTMIEVEQEPLDLIDAKVPEYVIALTHDACRNVLIDVGDGGVNHERTEEQSITIAPPDTEVRFRVSDPHRLLVAAIPADWQSRFLPDGGGGTEPLHAFFGQMHVVPAASRIMATMWDVSARDGAAASLHLDGLTLQLLAQLSGFGARFEIGRIRADDTRITRALDYIEAHYGDPLSVGELAVVAAMSPGHFSRSFKAATGEAVWAYVRRRRCERAREMILFTDAPLAEIAYRCGFAAQGHFTTAMKAQFGMTPGAMRAEAG
ncbi:MAG: AraC family transcriptional regulator [Pseudomonadota bacterium]